MNDHLQPQGHRRRLIDSGEYYCECGWSPDWHSNLSLNEAIAAHLPDRREDIE